MIGTDGRLPWGPLLAGGAAVLAVGIAVGYSFRPSSSATPETGVASDAPATDEGHQHGAAAVAPAAVAGDVVVTLTTEMAARAGIRTAEATAGTATTELRIPGVVQPNAYKEVIVTPLVSGRVTQVQAELGSSVAAQAPLATIYSPELADAQSAFISARAELTAHTQRLTRTQRLAAIGAATREELELHEAERAKIAATVENARARLVLLGIPEERAQRLAGPQDVVTTIAVRAPIAGVVTQRAANVGLNVVPSMPLFTVVDLSTVWVMADLFERDFGKVRVGSAVTITSAAYPDTTLRGRVGYIDPQVQQETRTAKLRVEVPNPGARLRFGMYVDVHVGEGTAQQGVFVPKTAVQMIGSDAVVYVATGQAGRFTERKVAIGDATGDQVLVRSGLQPGDPVVTDGVYFLRAERERTAAR